MAEFDFDEMRRLYKDGQLKEHLDCKNYISKYLYPLNNGTHALIEGGQVSIIQNETMNNVYFKRFPDDIKKWYLKETNPRKVICDIHKPTIGPNFINLAKKLKHEYQEYKSFSEEIKKGVGLMLAYIKDVWANNNIESYNYIIKWLANMTKGEKNKSCLYGKAAQGIGKSTLPEFLRDHVLGKDITCKGKADHLKGTHNLQLLGCLLVYFEELQFFSDKEWFAIDSELKDMITDTWGSYTDKYEKRFEAENINSYMVVTNSTLKGINGRRHFVCDLSPRYMNNFEYFGKLRKTCFNDEVGKAFYCYLVEIDTKDFNSLDMPETKNKLDIMTELLTPIEKFLKFNFVLRKSGINMKMTKLLELYKMYDNGKYANTTPQRLSAIMRELGFEYKKMDGYSTYIISYEELKKVADMRKWLHDLDDDMVQTIKEEEESDEDNGVKCDLSFNASLDEQILHYKKLVRDLEMKRIQELDTIYNERSKAKTEIKKESGKSGWDKYLQEPESTSIKKERKHQERKLKKCLHRIG